MSKKKNKKKVCNIGNKTIVSTANGGTVTVTSHSNGKMTVEIVNGRKELPEDRKQRINTTLKTGIEDKDFRLKRPNCEKKFLIFVI